MGRIIPGAQDFLIETCGHVMRRLVVIDGQYLQITNPEHPREVEHIELAREPRACLMPRVVKMQVRDLAIVLCLPEQSIQRLGRDLEHSWLALRYPPRLLDNFPRAR